MFQNNLVAVDGSPDADQEPLASEPLAVPHDARRAMLDAEDALRVVRDRFQRTTDLETQAELAAEALDYVERQLSLTRERRQQLDGIEGKLWDRRNRLERLLIQARGIAWWHARRDAARKSANETVRTIK